MKVYNSNEVKNVVLIGGAKTGKTTLAECMLFESGLISRRGSIEDKNTVSDYRPIELERQNSVSSTVLYAEFNGKKINIIDAPGFDDYVGEVTGDLNKRRAILEGIEAKVKSQIIKAHVPLSEMFGYVTSLRTNTSGRGASSMEFSHYAETPNNIAEEVIKKAKGL